MCCARYMPCSPNNSKCNGSLTYSSFSSGRIAGRRGKNNSSSSEESDKSTCNMLLILQAML